MIQKTLLSIALICTLTSAFAQKKPQPIKGFTEDEVSDAKREASSYFKSLNYLQAFALYERLVITDPKDVDYNYKLAVCYLNTNIAKQKAVPLLEYVVNANSKSIPKDARFDLACAYHYSGLFDKALETFESYRVDKNGTVDSKLKFDQWVGWSTTAKDLTTRPVDARFENMGKTINSAQADYRPITGSNDSVVYFSSKRKGNVGGLVDDLGEIPSDIYYFTQNDSSRSKAKTIGVNINTPFYEECLFVNMNADRMLIYREGQESSGDLSLSPLKGKQWDKPVSPGKQFVTKGAETGACMSPDGLTLYFAGESEGSKTGKDIYRCTRTEQTPWSKPERLGDNINSKEDEDCPYMWVDGKTMFFSSKGYNSMGGYDIFKITRKDSVSPWSKPLNLGYPINSTYDDILFIPDESNQTASYCTNRKNNSFEYLQVKLPQQELTSSIIKGQFRTLDSIPKKDAYITVYNSNTGEIAGVYKTNPTTGQYLMILVSGTK